MQIIISTVLAIAVLAGISMMSKVGSAVRGNLLSALAMLVGVVATLYFSGVVSAWTIYPSILVGALIGGMMARRVRMIQMPQLVALFNGLGGGASALDAGASGDALVKAPAAGGKAEVTTTGTEFDITIPTTTFAASEDYVDYFFHCDETAGVISMISQRSDMEQPGTAPAAGWTKYPYVRADGFFAQVRVLNQIKTGPVYFIPYID